MVIDKIGRGIGKITRKVSGLEPKIIEWTDSTPEDLVWRYPDEIIPWGSVVVVVSSTGFSVRSSTTEIGAPSPRRTPNFTTRVNPDVLSEN